MSDRTFISYAREDQDFVLELASMLKEREVPIWLDQWDIPAGADWDQAIDSALHECNQFLIVLSPAAVASRQVRGEIQTALDNDKLIVPVVYQKCPIPRPLRLVQYIDFTAHGLREEAKVAQLVRTLHVGKVVSRPSKEPSSKRKKKYRRALVLLAVSLLATVSVISSLWYLWYPHRQPDTVLNETSSRPSALQGNLQVNVNVDAAKVIIDGVEVGVARHAAPLFVSGIKVGQRRVRVEAEGYEPQERRVNIAANEWTQVGFVLRKRVSH